MEAIASFTRSQQPIQQQVQPMIPVGNLPQLNIPNLPPQIPQIITQGQSLPQSQVYNSQYQQQYTQSYQPKRFQSPYQIYSEYKIEALKQEFGASFNEMRQETITRHVARGWALLSKDEKYEFVQLAAQDKVRFFQEMKRIPNPNRGKRKRKKRDFRTPKKVLTSYMFFVKEQRPRLLRQFSCMGFVEVMRKISKLWNELSDDDKQPYKNLSIEDKTRHIEEQKSFMRNRFVMPSKTGPAQTNLTNTNSSFGQVDLEDQTTSKQPKVSKQNKKQPSKGKRGSFGGYLNFANEVRQQYREENPHLNMCALSKVIGQAWRELTTEEKQFYVDMNNDPDDKQYASVSSHQNSSEKFSGYRRTTRAETKDTNQGQDLDLIEISDDEDNQRASEKTYQSNVHNQSHQSQIGNNQYQQQYGSIINDQPSHLSLLTTGKEMTCLTNISQRTGAEILHNLPSMSLQPSINKGSNSLNQRKNFQAVQDGDTSITCMLGNLGMDSSHVEGTFIDPNQVQTNDNHSYVEPNNRDTLLSIDVNEKMSELSHAPLGMYKSKQQAIQMVAPPALGKIYTKNKASYKSTL